MAAQILTEQIKIALYAIREMEPGVKVDLLTKYDNLVEWSSQGLNDKIVENIDNYKILLNKTLFLSIVQNLQVVDLMNYRFLHSFVSKYKSADTGKTNSAPENPCRNEKDS